MKITQTLPLAVTALLACGFVYSDDFRTIVGAENRRSLSVQGDGTRNGSRAEQFAQAETQKKESDKASEDEPAKPGAPASEERQPVDVLLSALQKLNSYSSVRAKISEKMALPSTLSPQTYRFNATGEYLQGQNLRLKMMIEVKLSPELTGRLKEVCDGELLWTSYELGAKEKPEITRRDVRQILQALDKAQQGARIPVSEKEMQQAGLRGSLGLGGLPALLSSMEKTFEFKKLTTEKIDGRDVLTIEGTWQAKFLEGANPNKKAKDKDKSADPLPPHVPDVIRVSFDKETEFLRRIEYLKRVVGQTALKQLMVMDFTDPKFNERLGRDEFTFFPPNDAKPRDDTQQYLQRITGAKPGTTGAKPE